MPTATAIRSPGRLIADRYRLLHSVGAGGMATVYRARDERLKRDVAVKVIAEPLARNPSFVRRFRAEADLCARLAHRNVVAVLDAGMEPRDYIVMEFVHGVDAGSLLRREELTSERAVGILVQICGALAYVHSQGAVHHDVTPRNILVSRPGGTAKLADFGLASQVAGGPASGLPNLIGTAGYVAPEILLGASPSPRSDLYSLGVVAYRLLAGPSGAPSCDPEATAPRPTAAPRMPPLGEARPDLSRRLVQAVQQALARDPGARQESVAQFGAQLVDAQSALLEAARGELPRAA
jgi:serine/threonine protein kinase